jgi:hypothetical protein
MSQESIKFAELLALTCLLRAPGTLARPLYPCHEYNMVSLRDRAVIEERSRGPAPIQSPYHWPLSGVDESGR